MSNDWEQQRRLSEQDETMLLRRALSGEAARRSQESWPAQCSVEVYDIDGQLIDMRTVPPEGLTIGRSSDQDIRLPDRTVSRRHARIELADGHYWLDDTGSLNDTLLDGEPVRGRAELHDGAQLTIGLHTLRITVR
ncbi:MAG: FHA domain-containing protein [Armatimonadetes bacterium]|nr:FHA domain-containing protein [Armatimonadota bacterium]